MMESHKCLQLLPLLPLLPPPPLLLLLLGSAHLPSCSLLTPLAPACRSSKAAGLAAPFYFKRAVDAMSSGFAAAGGGGAAQAAAAGLVLFGACRALSGVAKELQGPVFAPVSQVGGGHWGGLLPMPTLCRASVAP